MFEIQDSELQVLIGLVVTGVLGVGVDTLIRRMRTLIPTPPPNKDVETVRLWTQLTQQKTGGVYIGFFERLLFFAALWIAGWWFLLTSWLVFKLAIYWQGSDFAWLPRTAPQQGELEWLVARRQLGARHAAKALVGTAANIVAALAGVAVGKWIN